MERRGDRWSTATTLLFLLLILLPLYESHHSVFKFHLENCYHLCACITEFVKEMYMYSYSSAAVFENANKSHTVTYSELNVYNMNNVHFSTHL